MNKKLSIVVIASLMIGAIAGIQSIVAHPESDPYMTDLIAGQYYDAGNVSVWNDGDAIHVTYQTTGDWYITGTNLYVGKTNPSLLNSAPGQFPYSEPDESNATTHSYVIALDDIDGYHLKLNKKGNPTGVWVANGDPGVEAGDTIYIAAHAGVCREIYVSGGLEDLEASLPDNVTVQAVHAINIPPYDQGYFKVNITGGTLLDGIYPGWCIDLDTTMINYNVFNASVYSSYETLPASLLSHIVYPETLDQINYILNQDFVGKPSGCDGNYTFGDVQRAIWALIENWQSSVYLGAWEQCRVDEILADADANGEGFIPGCGDVVALILEPNPLNAGQIFIIPVPITCDYETQCETAWGNGLGFPGSNWAMYFTYTVQ